jgi:hypothetical protein
MADPTPTPTPVFPPAPAAPSVADKAATVVDNVVAWIKVRVMSFVVGGGLGFLAPKLLSLLGL